MRWRKKDKGYDKHAQRLAAMAQLKAGPYDSVLWCEVNAAAIVTLDVINRDARRDK